MIRPSLLLLFVAVTGTSAFLFGSSCCQSSCCQPQSSCCGNPCGGGGGGYAVPQQNFAPQQGYAQGPPPAYNQPIAAPCRPKYIIVRQAEEQYQAPQPAGYAQPNQQGPVPPVPQTQETAPIEQPIETAPISNAQEAGYRAFASKTLADPKCNSVELRKIMEDQMSNDANESKRRVHKAANEQFQTADSERGIDVICAAGDFSYRIATDIFCEHTKNDIKCFVYQQHS